MKQTSLVALCVFTAFCLAAVYGSFDPITVRADDQNAPNTQEPERRVVAIAVGSCSLAANIEVESTSGTTSAAYTTLSSAFAAINAGTHTGTIIIEICGNTTELATASLNSGEILPASFSSVLIRPVGSQRIVEGNFAGATIKLAGADNVTIDGRLGGTGTTRDLTIRNNSMASATAAVWLSSPAVGNGATNNVVRNLEIAAGTDSSASANASFGIIMSGTTIGVSSNGTDNDNNQILSNRIIKARYGIVTRGTTANLNIAPIIEGNVVGSDTFGPEQIGKVGIFVQHDTGGIIRNNVVQNVGCLHTQSCTGADRMGIAVGHESWSGSPTTLASNTYTVTGNVIRNIIEEKNLSSVGLNSATTGGGNPTNNIIANNFIVNVRANGQVAEQTVGLAIAGGHSDIVVNNSIALFGDIDPGTTTSATTLGSGIRLGSINGFTLGHINLTLRNNSVYLDLSSNDATISFYAVSGTTATYSFGTGGEDTNNYYLNPANPQLRTGGLGSGSGPKLAAEFLTLANWRTAYTAPQDTSSIQVDPLYVSLSDLHIQNGSPNVGVAVPIPGIVNDFDGDPRDVVAPDIGADEYIAPATSGTIQFAAGAYSGLENSGTITVTATRTGGSGGAASVDFGVAGFIAAAGKRSGIPANVSVAELGVSTATGGASCTNGVDYITPSGTLNWADGDLADKTFDVLLCPDSVFEPDEAFIVILTSAAGTTLGTPANASVTIQNDDAEPTPTPTPTPQTLLVDTTGDEPDANPGDGNCATAVGACTLRAAIEESNALAGEQVIEFEFVGANLGTPTTITLGGTEIVITGDVIITGLGADLLTIDGGPGTNRIFSAGSGVSLELTGMTLTGGNGIGALGSGLGGAVSARGDLTLDGMHVAANTADACGGVNVEAGTHVIRNTTLSGNTSTGSGGGLCATLSSNVTLENSTFSGNTVTSGFGGGISFNTVASLLITNSTIFANTSLGGGGLRILSSNGTVRSSIIAGNTGGSTPEISSGGGVVLSGGFNLIGDSAGDSTNTGSAIIYLSTDIVDVDPRLGLLANNGGPTPTHRVLATSLAIDKGNSFGLPTDQRGLARIFNFPGVIDAGDGADIGAYEHLGPTAAAVKVSGFVRTAGGLPIRNALVTIFGGDLVEPVTVATGSFGSYSFNGLRAGQTYIVTVSAGRYTFPEPVRTVVPVDNMDDLDFVAN